MADTGLQIEPGTNRTGIQRLHLGTINAAANSTFAFGLDDETVDVAAEPAFTVPAIQSSNITASCQ